VNVHCRFFRGSSRVDALVHDMLRRDYLGALLRTRDEAA
jgi:hypothetical protein